MCGLRGRRARPWPKDQSTRKRVDAQGGFFRTRPHVFDGAPTPGGGGGAEASSTLARKQQHFHPPPPCANTAALIASPPPADAALATRPSFTTHTIARAPPDSTATSTRGPPPAPGTSPRVRRRAAAPRAAARRRPLRHRPARTGRRTRPSPSSADVAPARARSSKLAALVRVHGLDPRGGGHEPKSTLAHCAGRPRDGQRRRAGLGTRPWPCRTGRAGSRPRARARRWPSK